MKNTPKPRGWHNKEKILKFSQGSGIVFDIRSALGWSQSELDAFLGSTRAVAKWESAGTPPDEKRGLAYRVRLLKAARQIPISKLTLDVQEWIESETARLQGISEGGVFL